MSILLDSLASQSRTLPSWTGGKRVMKRCPARTRQSRKEELSTHFIVASLPGQFGRRRPPERLCRCFVDHFRRFVFLLFVVFLCSCRAWNRAWMVRCSFVGSERLVPGGIPVLNAFCSYLGPLYFFILWILWSIHVGVTLSPWTWQVTLRWCHWQSWRRPFAQFDNVGRLFQSAFDLVWCHV